MMKVNSRKSISFARNILNISEINTISVVQQQLALTKVSQQMLIISKYQSITITKLRAYLQMRAFACLSTNPISSLSHLRAEWSTAAKMCETTNLTQCQWLRDGVQASIRLVNRFDAARLNLQQQKAVNDTQKCH